MITVVSLAAAGQLLPGSPAIRPAEADVPCADPRHRFSASHNDIVANFWAEGTVWKAQVWDLLVLQGVWSSDSVEELFHFVFGSTGLTRRGPGSGRVARN
jgi:hypothetical protein